MSDPSRIAVVSTHPVQYYAPLFRQLAQRDALDIHVFYGWRGPSEGAYDPGFGADVTWDIPLLEGYPHTFLENTASDPGTHHFRGIVTPSLVPAVKAWNPDALLIFGWNYWSHLAAMRHFYRRLPVFFRGDSTLLDETPGIKRWVRRVALRWIYRYVDTALYAGENNRAYFEAHGLRDEQLYWVPHAIDNDRFEDKSGRAKQEARAWCRDLGIPPEAPTVVFAGKLSHKKGPDLLLNAFEQLDTRGAHLVVVGSGPEEETLRQRASGLPNVHFLGFQNQSRMPVVYRLGDVFVLPSRGPGETWGLAINEAMACGRAVVASDKVGCAPDLIEPRENGYVFPANDAVALRRVLSQLMDDKEQCRRMGRAGRKLIGEWSIEGSVERHEHAVVHRLKARGCKLPMHVPGRP